MNPFLTGVTILFWAIFCCSLILAYLSKPEKSKECGLIAIIFFVLAFFATIVAAEQWHSINKKQETYAR